MSNFYYIHTDFFNYLSHNLKNIEFFKKDQKNINKYFYKMLGQLKDITNNRIIIPTYNYDFGKKKVFDLYNDKSHVGAFSEFFRKKFISTRTKVPFFSSCSTVKRHYADEKGKIIDPFGESSDFNLLKENKGKLINFGSSFAPTFIIFIERFIPGGPLYRYEKIFNGKIRERRKETKVSLVYIVRPKGIDISYDLGKIKSDLIRESILKVKKTKNNFSYDECDAKDFFYFSLEKIKKNPLYFLNKKTINFLNSNKILKKGRIKLENFEKENYDI